MRVLRTSPATLLLAALALTGCQESEPPTVTSPPTGPIDREELIGTYDAVQFSTVEDDVETDLLAMGAVLTLTLEASAQYDGAVAAPGIGPGGSDLNEMLEGAWSFDIVTRRVRFPAGSPLLDADFIPERAADPNIIRLSATIPAGQFQGSPTIVIVLEQR